MNLAIGFVLGYVFYHFLMNRTVMMRDCCVRHFETHATCRCADCTRERMDES